MSADELHRHLSQLLQDGNIKCENNSNGIGRYQVITKGEKLVADGGYKSSYDERDRIRRTEKISFFLEVVIAVSTGMAAIYYFVQLVWGNVHLIHHCCE